MVHELMTSFLSFMSEKLQYRKETHPKKDFQVENGLVTGIAEGVAMALRKPEKTHEENGNEGCSPLPSSSLAPLAPHKAPAPWTTLQGPSPYLILSRAHIQPSVNLFTHLSAPLDSGSLSVT